MTKLVLFDIDGTLVNVKGSHAKVFALAFKEILGLDLDYTLFGFHGYTDLQVIHELMETNKIEEDPAVVAKIINVMIEKFKNEGLGHALLLPGVSDLLEKMKPKREVIVGLVTGNIEEIAYTKLRHFNIETYFVLGGFGHRSAIRSDLIKHAREKAEKKFGAINKKDVFIIGDTPRDIEAAREEGVNVIAVATGKFSYDLLKEKNPDHLFHDLKETNKILNVIAND